MRRAVCSVFAVYLLLALKWYPGTVDGRFCLHAPLRVCFFGLSEEFANPGHITVIEREAWPLLLAVPVGLALYAFLVAVWQLIPAAWRALRRGLGFRPGLAQSALRLFVWAATLNVLRLPINRATFLRLEWLDVVFYGLFPIAVPLLLLYYAWCLALRALAFLVNPLVVPCREPPHPASVLVSEIGRSYDYQGLLTEAFRFIPLMVLAGVIIGVLSTSCQRWPRLGAAVLICLGLSLIAFAAIWAVSPGTLR